MTKSDVFKSLIDKAYKKCPFIVNSNKLKITNVFEVFKSLIFLCPYMKKHANDQEFIDKVAQIEKIKNETITDKSVIEGVIAVTNYGEHFNKKIRDKKENSTYRTFYRIGRLADEYPLAESYPVDCHISNTELSDGKKVTVWCSNDYLGMSRHEVVVYEAINTIKKYGVGSGGTRNISGNNILHEQLEHTLAGWYQKEAGLIFTSCYVANSTTLCTLAKLLPKCIIFSDEGNHASMIEGINNSRCEKHIYKHNDVNELEMLLNRFDKSIPKIVAFESVNSMSGTIAPIKEICDLAHKYGAITFLDEVHAVGLYGFNGSGVSEQQNCLDCVDIISGTLGKAVGTVGGFIVGKAELVDMIRSYGPGFIFTTSLPPSVMSSSIKSIKVLQSDEGRNLRKVHQSKAAEIRRRIARLGFPLFPSVSHIVPIHVGDSHLCSKVSKHLMNDHNIYVQPINYPTVKNGTERLRIAPTPSHEPESVEHLLHGLKKAWEFAGLKTLHPPCSERSCNCNHVCSTFIRSNPQIRISCHS